MERIKGFQKRFLRGLAHGLKPVVLVGQKGFPPTLVKAMDEAVQLRVDKSLNVARDILARAGGVNFSTRQVNWEAVNQYTKTKRSISLPEVLVGRQGIAVNASFDTETPVVDELTDMVG